MLNEKISKINIYTLSLHYFHLISCYHFLQKKYEDIPCPTRIENDVDINEIA